MRDFVEELKVLFLELRPAYIGKAGESIGTKTKPIDGTPVTDLDNFSLLRIRRLIAKYFPDDFTIGEEDQRSDVQEIIARKDQIQWTVDGLDGTGNLRAGLNSFGALLSRRFGDQVLFAAALKPIDSFCRGNGFFYAEFEKGTWEWYEMDQSYHKLQVALPGQLDRIVVMLEGSSKRFFKPPITNLGINITTRCSFSSCVASTAVARGLVNAMVTVDNKPWDNWPAIGLIEGAGGVVTDFQGNPRSLSDCGSMVATANEKDLARILELLSEVEK